MRVAVIVVLLFASGCGDEQRTEPAPHRPGATAKEAPRPPSGEIKSIFRAPPRPPAPADDLLTRLPNTMDQLEMTTRNVEGNLAYAAYMAEDKQRAVAVNMQIVADKDQAAFADEVKTYASAGAAGASHKAITIKGFPGYVRHVTKDKSAEAVVQAGRVRVRLSVRPAKGQKSPDELIGTIDLEGLGKF